MLVQMVSAGSGVAALPTGAISEFSPRQGLIASKPLGNGLSRRLFAVRNSEKDKRYLQAFF